MTLSKTLCTVLAGGLGAALSILPLSAATVTYTNSDADPKVQLVVDDTAAGAGKFRFTDDDPLVGAADFLGLGFNLAGSGNPLTLGMFSLVGATKANGGAISPAFVLYGNDTGNADACGGGCNFNGLSAFDYILRIGDNGAGANNYVRSVTFDLTYAGSLASNPFSHFGVRAQATSSPTGSIKVLLSNSTTTSAPPPAVPLPASAVLLLGGVAGLFGLRRKR